MASFFPPQAGGVSEVRNPLQGEGSQDSPLVFVPRDWDEAILTAFRKVCDQVDCKVWPTFDWAEGAANLARVVYGQSGTGATQTYGATQGGYIAITKGSDAGGFSYTATPANFVFDSFTCPIAIAARVSLGAVGAGTTAQLVDITNLTTYDVSLGVKGDNSTLKLTLWAAMTGGSAVVTTSFNVADLLGKWVDVGLLWDGCRVIAFMGQAMQGTFVPDLTNVLVNLNFMGSPAMTQARGKSLIGDSTTTNRTLNVDKLNMWTGVVL